MDKNLVEILLLIIENNYTKAHEMVCKRIREKSKSRYGGPKGDSYIYVKKYCEEKM
jgi:hypothetical protein